MVDKEKKAEEDGGSDGKKAEKRIVIVVNKRFVICVVIVLVVIAVAAFIFMQAPQEKQKPITDVTPKPQSVCGDGRLDPGENCTQDLPKPQKLGAGEICNDSSECKDVYWCIAENVTFIERCSDITLSKDKGKNCSSDSDCEGRCYAWGGVEQLRCSPEKNTSDGGKECEEDEDCEGKCSSNYPIKMTGKCSSPREGCFAKVLEGYAKRACVNFA